MKKRDEKFSYSKIIFASSIFVVGSLISGCTLTSTSTQTESSNSAGSSSSTSNTNASSAGGAPIQEIFGPSGMKFSELELKFPAEFDTKYEKYLIEERASGKKSFEVNIEKGKSLALRVFCDSPAKYAVEVLINSEVVSGYSGANCGLTGPFVEYVTPSLDATNVTVSYQIPDHVGYRTMVAQTTEKVGQ